jgi:choline-phosphate cytidylyltransferase
VGVAGEEDIHKHKGSTIMSEFERMEIIKHCKWVDEVICPCPWLITDEFMKEQRIDYVAHDAEPYKSVDSDDIYAGVKS